ncbi:hypothetical protein B9Z19DRAFT_1119000 [Tuber borchii]|uniref:Uncharacterized protein n=1 Tax=Tuber borchii TaxID=42251 RepID=A0A2T7A701_TUBBO|nr:hypothetical protein B9Z19DRAFT_1119000 [Tuber borchii]
MTLASIEILSMVKVGRPSDLHGLVTVQEKEYAFKFTIVDIGKILQLAYLIAEEDWRESLRQQGHDLDRHCAGTARNSRKSTNSQDPQESICMRRRGTIADTSSGWWGKATSYQDRTEGYKASQDAEDVNKSSDVAQNTQNIVDGRKTSLASGGNADISDAG